MGVARAWAAINGSIRFIGPGAKRTSVLVEKMTPADLAIDR